MSTNRPGLGAITYRLGTYTSFRRKMLDDILSIDGPDGPPGLRPLSTRQDADYSITLIDLWAAVADILTFYQERYANESFVGTAQAPESLASLAALTGQAVQTGTPAPTSTAPATGIAAPASAGAGASTQLLLSAARNASVPIPIGLRVQSVPGPGEVPQTFETLAEGSADWRFNRLRFHPVPVGSPDTDPFRAQATEALLSPALGPVLSARLKPGDKVILFTSGVSDPVEEKKIDQLVIDEERVTLKWKTPIELPGHTQAYKFTRTFHLFGWNAPTTFAKPENLPDNADRVQWRIQSLTDTSYPLSDEEQPPTDHFGHAVQVDGIGVVRLCLDSRYDGIEIGRRLFIADRYQDLTQLPPVQGTGTLVNIVRVDEVEDTFGPLPRTVTRVWVGPASPGATLPPSMLDRRVVTVYELTDEIAFWDKAYPSGAAAHWTDTIYLPGQAVKNPDGSLRNDAIELGLSIAKGAFQPGVVIAESDIETGRNLILSDANGLIQAVRVQSAHVAHPDPSAPGELANLQMVLDSVPAVDLTSAFAMGNLVTAGHGRTVTGEVLGSSDGSVPFQTFTLQKKPLTCVPDPDSGTLTSSLRVYVDSLQWFEVAGLGDQAPTAEVFTTTVAADGTVTVQFGDGQHGKIPPTGRSNVGATYRFGSGAAGNVRAHTLTTLLDRPTGLLSADNPEAASGGVDPGSAVAARQSIGARVRTLGRAITPSDFADLAITAGAAQCSATLVFDGRRRTLVVTVVGQQGRPPTRDQLSRVSNALAMAHDPALSVQVLKYEPVPVVLRAQVNVDAGSSSAQVVERARMALLNTFSGDSARLGRPIQPSDLVATLEQVPGVTGVRVLAFDRKDPSSPAGVLPVIPIRAARVGQGGTLLPAQMAVVETPGQDVSVEPSGGTGA